MLLPKLVLSNLSVHRVRAALTVAAIALSVSLVVAVTTGYSSALAAATKYLGVYMGTADLTISRGKGDPHGTFTQTIADDLRADPKVALVLSRFGTGTNLLDDAGKRLPGRLVDIVGVQRPADTAVDTMKLE